MTLKTRRILYITFIVIFFLSAPPLVLYTAGFRYDFKYNRVVETGSLVVKTYPEQANIYINGTQIGQNTPTILNTILPGKINLLVTLDGYHAWEKEIKIKPRVTTFEDRIKLFADTDPIPLLEREITQYWWNKNFDKIAYTTTSNTLRVFNTLNSKDTLIANLLNKPLKNIEWSPHSDQILIGRQNKLETEYFIVDANAFDRIISINNTTSTSLNSVQWDPINKSSIYGLTPDGSLVRLNFLLKSTRQIFSGPVIKYLASNNKVVFIYEFKI